MRVCIGVICALHACLLFRSAQRQSVTFDEYAHLPAGLAYWKTGRFEVYAHNPPLIKLLSAAPALLMGATFPEVPAGDERFIHWELGERFLRANFQVYPKLFTLCRLVPISLSVIGALLVAHWSWRAYGPSAALLATMLYASCPNFAAHASLVTTDLGATVFILAAAYAVWAFFCFGRWQTLLWAGLLTGLALCCKFTALLLFPIVGVVTVAGIALRAGRHAARSIVGLPVIALMSLVVVNACYGFSGSAKPLKEYELESTPCRAAQRWLGSVPVPLPYAYVRGFDRQTAEAAGIQSTYILGRYVPADVWYYYPVAILVKTPLAFLPLLALRGWTSLTLARRRLRRWAQRDMYLLTFALLLLLGFAFATRVKLGIRYLLPCAPFLYIWLGGLLARWPGAVDLKPDPSGLGTLVGPRAARATVWRGVAIALAVAFTLEAQHVHPRYLSFFNVAAGGPARGHRWLTDSNLDWGQSLIDLRDFLRQRGIRHIQLAYFGSVDPGVYGIDYAPLLSPPREEWVGISAYFLMGGDQRLPTPDGPTPFYVPGAFFAPLASRTPEALVGDTIFIYRFPEFARDAAAGTEEQRN